MSHWVYRCFYGNANDLTDEVADWLGGFATFTLQRTDFARKGDTLYLSVWATVTDRKEAQP